MTSTFIRFMNNQRIETCIVNLLKKAKRLAETYISNDIIYN